MCPVAFNDHSCVVVLVQMLPLGSLCSALMQGNRLRYARDHLGQVKFNVELDGEHQRVENQIQKVAVAIVSSQRMNSKNVIDIYAHVWRRLDDDKYDLGFPMSDGLLVLYCDA